GCDRNACRPVGRSWRRARTPVAMSARQTESQTGAKGTREGSPIMAGLPRKTGGRSLAAFMRPALLTAFALLAVCSGGCVAFHSLCCTEQAPTGPACKVVARWETHLVETPDSVNGGVPLRGLAGRMYLLGPDQPTGDVSPPLSGDGEVIVD